MAAGQRPTAICRTSRCGRARGGTSCSSRPDGGRIRFTAALAQRAGVTRCRARCAGALRLRRAMTVLVHLASGIGNIVLATPLLVALGELGFTVDVRLSADYPQTADLLRPWSLVRQALRRRPSAARKRPRRYDVFVPAIPPFYWRRFPCASRRCSSRSRGRRTALRGRDEQAYYLELRARARLLADRRPPACRLPIGARARKTRVGS